MLAVVVVQQTTPSQHLLVQVALAVAVQVLEMQMPQVGQQIQAAVVVVFPKYRHQAV
jgi:hypothetical protein